MTVQILLFESDGHYHPVILCDFCQGVVTHENNGAVYYGYDGPVIFAHKECPDGLHREPKMDNGDPSLWMPLDVWWVYLGRNLHISRARAGRWARVWGSL